MDYDWELCEQKYQELSEGDLVVYLMDSAEFFYSCRYAIGLIYQHNINVPLCLIHLCIIIIIISIMFVVA